MARIRPAEQTLTFLTQPARQNYVCLACRAHAFRQLHTTRVLAADQGFFKRMRDSLFGSKQSKEDEKKRGVKAQERAKADAAKEGPETLEDTKGRKYEVAAIVDSTVNPEYVEATNWDGLPRIGGEAWMKEKLDRGEPYVGFVPAKRTKLSNTQWETLLHHVTVEVLTLTNAGRDADEVCLSRANGEGKGWEYTRTAKITTSGGADTSVTFESSTAEESVLSSILRANRPEEQRDTEEQQVGQENSEEPSVDAEQPGSDLQAAELSALINQSMPQPERELSWMSLQLKDPLVKFAIAKRITQLTGHRISDPAISTAATLADVYTILKTKPTPKTLFQTPELQRLQSQLPNVRVYPKRQTPIHKEKAIGRWKVIEDELVARNLPVTGSRWQGAKPRIGVER